MNITTWGDAIRDLLSAANVRQTELADHLKMELPTINRYMHGDRRPDGETALRVSRAVAQLAGNDRIEAYLNLEAIACGLLGEDHDDALAEGAARCLRWYNRFFKAKGIEIIFELVSARNGAEARKMLLDLNRAFRRIAVAELLPPAKPVGFTCVYDALSAGGIDVEEVASEHSAALLAWERFEWTVQRELAAQNPHAPARERLAAMQRILNALVNPEALGAIEVTTDARTGLREVVTWENGRRVSRFFSDAKTAWAPFMPSTGRAVVKKGQRAPSPRRKRGK